MRTGANSLLRKSILDADVSGVRKALSLGANPNKVLILGTAPLHDACKTGNAEIVEILLEAGAHVNVPDAMEINGRQTPLHYAATCDNPVIASLLIARGADADSRDSQQRTPAQLAIGDDLSGLISRPAVILALATAQKAISTNSELLRLLKQLSTQHPSHVANITQRRNSDQRTK